MKIDRLQIRVEDLAEDLSIFSILCDSHMPWFDFLIVKDWVNDTFP